jgi:hypothetical protein
MESFSFASIVPRFFAVFKDPDHLTKEEENMREARKSAEARHLLAIPECLSMMRETSHKDTED